MRQQVPKPLIIQNCNKPFIKENELILTGHNIRMVSSLKTSISLRITVLGHMMWNLDGNFNVQCEQNRFEHLTLELLIYSNQV